jgi:hypothetical protein
MEPVTVAIIAGALAGATSGVTDAAKTAVVDAYEGLKSLIKRKFGNNSDVADAIEKLQAKPESLGRRETLREELGAVDAAGDPELLGAANSLLQLIKNLPQGEQHVQAARGIGIAQADHGSTASVSISGSPFKKSDD